MSLQIILRSILHAFSPITSQLVHCQFFEKRPSLLGLALAPFSLALSVRYLGIRGRLADAAGGGSLSKCSRFGKWHRLTAILFTNFKIIFYFIFKKSFALKKIICQVSSSIFTQNFAHLDHPDKYSERAGRVATWCGWTTWAYWRWRSTEVAN